jgi:hypothetical protein
MRQGGAAPLCVPTAEAHGRIVIGLSLRWGRTVASFDPLTPANLEPMDGANSIF